MQNVGNVFPSLFLLNISVCFKARETSRLRWLVNGLEVAACLDLLELSSARLESLSLAVSGTVAASAVTVAVAAGCARKDRSVQNGEVLVASLLEVLDTLNDSLEVTVDVVELLGVVLNNRLDAVYAAVELLDACRQISLVLAALVTPPENEDHRKDDKNAI